MQAVGHQFRQAGVSAIYLVHGSLVGDDAHGFFATLGQLFPQYESQLREIAKKAIDVLISDAGNYTPEFAQLFEESIGEDDAPPIPVRLFHWSGQNNHIGRADAAVQLVEALMAKGETSQPNGSSDSAFRLSPTATPPRVLLWGHSHAGNAFALLSNLLAADEETLSRFFKATRPYYEWPLIGCEDLPLWPRVWKMLQATERPIDRLALDFVTYGTPIRYGWDTTGYSNLLHIINHRPSSGCPSHLAPFPPRIDRLARADDGDFIQQFGIAGTNFAPNLLAWRAFLADYRLNDLLQPGLRKRDLLDRLEIGARVPDEGTSVLVNYGPDQGSLSEHALGHAVYTRSEWLLYHAETVAQQFYAS